GVSIRTRSQLGYSDSLRNLCGVLLASVVSASHSANKRSVGNWGQGHPWPQFRQQGSLNSSPRPTPIGNWQNGASQPPLPSLSPPRPQSDHRPARSPEILKFGDSLPHRLDE